MDTLKREVLSQRVRQVKPSGIRKFFDIINTMPDVISLGVGEPDFVTPVHIRQAGIRSIELGHTRYTSNYGMIELREEIAAMLSLIPATKLSLLIRATSPMKPISFLRVGSLFLYQPMRNMILACEPRRSKLPLRHAPK